MFVFFSTECCRRMLAARVIGMTFCVGSRCLKDGAGFWYTVSINNLTVPALVTTWRQPLLSGCMLMKCRLNLTNIVFQKLLANDSHAAAPVCVRSPFFFSD